MTYEILNWMTGEVLLRSLIKNELLRRPRVILDVDDLVGRTYLTDPDGECNRY